MTKSVVIIGAGIFGVTAAIELGDRGWEVTLIDPGPPHPHFRPWAADIAGLVVSTGGSGHGFKFAPILRSLAADVIHEAATPDRFRWRAPGTIIEEAARHQG